MAKEHYYTQAIWSATAASKKYPQLSRDVEVDVAIIGGGITGISTAYNLIKAGKRVAVLEARELASGGTTGSSTGNIYSTTGALRKISSKHDTDTVAAVAHYRKAAIDFIEERVIDFDIDCEFKRVPWYYFSTSETGKNNEQVNKELNAALQAGLPASDQTPEDFPYQTTSMARLDSQAQFNPLRYVQQLAAGIAGENCLIFENSKILDITDGDPCVLKTADGTVRAKKVVQATHTPKGVYAVHTAMEVFREHAFAVRLKGELPAPGIYWHMHEKELYSVRPYRNEGGNYLLVLDASHSVGHKIHTEESWKKVEKYMRAHFDVDKIEYIWAAQNYKPMDHLPFIGISPMESNIYIATGFAADGLVWGTVASMIIRDAILGHENQRARYYNPNRVASVATSKKFIKENVHVAKHLVKDYLFKGDEKELEGLKPGEAKILELDGDKIAAYREESGKLHSVAALCTHMGCTVEWNNGEKSWDCPCHGSRFSVEGGTLEGPAIENLPNKMSIK